MRHLVLLIVLLAFTLTLAMPSLEPAKLAIDAAPSVVSYQGSSQTHTRFVIAPMGRALGYVEPTNLNRTFHTTPTEIDQLLQLGCVPQAREIFVQLSYKINSDLNYISIAYNMFASNSYNTRLPASSTMLKSLIMAENAAEESALEYYENCNLVWRAEFTDPTIASPGIGTQFQPLKKSRKEKSSAYGDTDSENNQNGWTCLNNRCRL